jgi:hypothetical protein
MLVACSLAVRVFYAYLSGMKELLEVYKYERWQSRI